MTNLRKVADEYLAVRRRLGFALVDAGRLLPDFVAFLEQRGVEHISIELALEWAARPSDAQPTWRRFRLGVVRGFAEYVRHTDPATQVPPPNLLPSNYRRVAPYLYSEHEIAAMMAAARLLAPPLRAATYETLIGLIAVTGMRIGEAIGLDRDDIDEQTRLLTVRDGKRGGRQVPLHETTLHALADYGRVRDQRFPQPVSTSLLVSIRGTRLCRSSIYATFPGLLRQAGIGADQPRRPRVHDLRHSFAVCQLLDWHRQGVDVDTKLPLLTSVLGHANPVCTYWYLQASPQLLAVAGGRLADVLGELP
jgi:integrase/recombinase XerD